MLICATDDGGDNGRRNGFNKKNLKNVIIDSPFELFIFKIDFDSTRHLNTSNLSNNYNHLHAKCSFWRGGGSSI